MKIAVQVYSVRDCIKDAGSLLKALEEIKKIGYDGVEFAGYFGAEAETIKAKLDELGLAAVGGHIGIEAFKPGKLEETLKFQKILGVKSVGVGGAPHSTLKECEKTGKILGDAQKYAEEKYGMKVYYHNHCEEFKPFKDGRTPIEVIGGLCSLEIDAYWSYYAGADNYSLITKNKDKIVHIHVKDGVNGKPKALGEGDCDIPAVVKAAEEIGLEWLIVENDDPVPNGFEDVARSLKYLEGIIGKKEETK